MSSGLKSAKERCGTWAYALIPANAAMESDSHMANCAAPKLHGAYRFLGFLSLFKLLGKIAGRVVADGLRRQKRAMGTRRSSSSTPPTALLSRPAPPPVSQSGPHVRASRSRLPPDVAKMSSSM